MLSPGLSAAGQGIARLGWGRSHGLGGRLAELVREGAGLEEILE